MKIVLYVIGAFVLFIIYVRYLEKSSLFYPSREITAVLPESGLTYEDVYFSTADHIKLNGWLFEHGPDRPVVLFFHGNAGNIGDRLGKVGLFYEMGLNVFIIDYRGYGLSEGRPTEKGLYLDAAASFQFLLERGYKSEKIIIYGASLGGVPAVDLAAQVTPAALIIDSSFSNARDMARVIYPFIPSFLVNIKLDSMQKIKAVKAPKLFIHSRDDRTVPFELGMKLYEAAAGPKQFLEVSGDHNDGHFYDHDIYRARLMEYLRRLRLI